MSVFTKEEVAELKAQYEDYKSQGLKLDMSRGKPCTEQLDLTCDMLTVLDSAEKCKGVNGFDYRNYGLLEGIPEAKKLFAELMGVKENMVLVGGNSSLNMMYDSMMNAMHFGVLGSDKPWSAYDKVSFLCVVPGYDRHFSVCESLGINMINVPLLSDGPDMDEVERLVASDESIKGIWCVPKYSNPDGITYSDEVVRRFAALKPAAKDFRIYWDNAYAVHDLDENDKDELLNIFDEAEKCGNENMIYMFCSTSKISFPGAGVAAMIMSPENIAFYSKKMFFQTIGPDKLNQMRHILYFKDANGIRDHMKKHAAIIKPHFECVLNTLEKEVKGICRWHRPKGGYFISLYVPDGCAKRVVELMKEAGVAVTAAGSSYPYKKDPHDSNIRISPTYPSLDDLQKAMDILCVCCKLAYAEKLGF